MLRLMLRLGRLLRHIRAMQVPGGASLALATRVLGYTLDLPRSAFPACISWHCGSSEGFSRGWFLAPRCVSPSRRRCLGVYLFEERYTLMSLSSTPCGQTLKQGPGTFSAEGREEALLRRSKSSAVGSRLIFIHRAKKVSHPCRDVAELEQLSYCYHHSQGSQSTHLTYAPSVYVQTLR